MVNRLLIRTKSKKYTKEVGGCMGWQIPIANEENLGKHCIELDVGCLVIM